MACIGCKRKVDVQEEEEHIIYPAKQNNIQDMLYKCFTHLTSKLQKKNFEKIWEDEYHNKNYPINDNYMDYDNEDLFYLIIKLYIAKQQTYFEQNFVNVKKNILIQLS